MEKRWLTIKDLSNYIDLSEKAIRNMIWRGQLPHIKIGRRVRFDRFEIDRWLEKQKIEPVEEIVSRLL